MVAEWEHLAAAAGFACLVTAFGLVGLGLLQLQQQFVIATGTDCGCALWLLKTAFLYACSLVSFSASLAATPWLAPILPRVEPRFVHLAVTLLVARVHAPLLGSPSFDLT